jgi:hypothetical protein
MAKCPTCGKEVKNATKTWKMAGKPDKKGKRTQLTIALYKCCDKSFREVLDKKKNLNLKTSIFLFLFFLLKKLCVVLN